MARTGGNIIDRFFVGSITYPLFLCRQRGLAVKQKGDSTSRHDVTFRNCECPVIVCYGIFLAEDTGLEPVSGFPRLFSKEIPYQLG